VVEAPVLLHQEHHVLDVAEGGIRSGSGGCGLLDEGGGAGAQGGSGHAGGEAALEQPPPGELAAFRLAGP